jgi:hypothetical protein
MSAVLLRIKVGNWFTVVIDERAGVILAIDKPAG